jgi:thioredoxin 1
MDELEKIKRRKLREMQEKAKRPIHLSDGNFKEAIKNNRLVLVDFYADWCHPCQMIAPEIEALASSLQDVVVAKLNVDENQQTAREYGVMSIPTLILFKDGKEVERIIGAVPRSSIEEKIKPYL